MSLHFCQNIIIMKFFYSKCLKNLEGNKTIDEPNKYNSNAFITGTNDTWISYTSNNTKS
jgi:hypothetical protein